MSEAPWVKWYAGDFLNGIADLGPNEIAVYAVVLNLIYDHGSSIADDVARISRRCGMRQTACEKALVRLVEAGKLKRQDGLISNRRAEKEIERRQKVSEKSAENARARWGVEKEKTNENNNSKMQPHDGGISERNAIQKPEARSQIDDVDLKAGAPQEPKEEVAKEVEVGHRVAEIFGLANDPRWLGSYGVAAGWLAAGFDPEKDIYPAAKEIVERFRKQRKPVPHSLNYLTSVLNSRAQELKANVAIIESMPKPETVTVRAGSAEFKAWQAHYRAKGQRTAFMDKSETWQVPTRWPPEHRQAAE